MSPKWLLAALLASGSSFAAEEAVILTPKPGPAPASTGPASSASARGRPSSSRSPRPASGRCASRPEVCRAACASTRRPDGSADRSPLPGTHAVTLSATNRHGTASSPVPHRRGGHAGPDAPHGLEQLVRAGRTTSPTGSCGMRPTPSSRSGLADHGYQYVNIDDCWAVKPGAKEADLQRPEPRDAEGRVNANARFPDMRALTDYIHGLGLKAGIYTSPGPTTCAGHVGAWQHEEQDAPRFVEWGFDFLKYDWCSYGKIAGKEPSRRGAAEALPADGRDPEKAAARRRPEPLPIRHGRGLGVGPRGGRPQLAHRRRPRSDLRGHRDGPLQGRLRRVRRATSCTGSAAPGPGTTPTTCCSASSPTGRARPRRPRSRPTSSTRTSRSGRSSPPPSSSAAT